MPSEPVTISVEGLGEVSIRPLTSARLRVVARDLTPKYPVPALVEIVRRALGPGLTTDLALDLGSDLPTLLALAGEILEHSEPAPARLEEALAAFAVAVAKQLAGLV